MDVPFCRNIRLLSFLLYLTAIVKASNAKHHEADVGKNHSQHEYAGQMSFLKCITTCHVSPVAAHAFGVLDLFAAMPSLVVLFHEQCTRLVVCTSSTTGHAVSGIFQAQNCSRALVQNRN